MCFLISDAFASNPLDVGSYLDRPRFLRPCLDAAEFLDERADVCRLLEFHDFAAPKREHVHPSESTRRPVPFRCATNSSTFFAE